MANGIIQEQLMAEAKGVHNLVSDRWQREQMEEASDYSRRYVNAHLESIKATFPPLPTVDLPTYHIVADERTGREYGFFTGTREHRTFLRHLRFYDQWFYENVESKQFFQLTSRNASAFSRELDKRVKQQEEIAKDLTTLAVASAPVGKLLLGAKHSYNAYKAASLGIPGLPKTWNGFQIALGRRGLGLNSKIMAKLWKAYKGFGLQKLAQTSSDFWIKGYAVLTSGVGAAEGLTSDVLHPSYNNPFLIPYEIGREIGGAIRNTAYAFD